MGNESLLMENTILPLYQKWSFLLLAALPLGLNSAPCWPFSIIASSLSGPHHVSPHCSFLLNSPLLWSYFVFNGWTCCSPLQWHADPGEITELASTEKVHLFHYQLIEFPMNESPFLTFSAAGYTITRIARDVKHNLKRYNHQLNHPGSVE